MLYLLDQSLNFPFSLPYLCLVVFLFYFLRDYVNFIFHLFYWILLLIQKIVIFFLISKSLFLLWSFLFMVSCYFICSYFSEGVTYIFWLMKFFSAPHVLFVSYLKCRHTGILLHVGAFPQVSREPWLCLNERSRHLKAGWGVVVDSWKLCVHGWGL